MGKWVRYTVSWGILWPIVRLMAYIPHRSIPWVSRIIVTALRPFIKQELRRAQVRIGRVFPHLVPHVIARQSAEHVVGVTIRTLQRVRLSRQEALRYVDPGNSASVMDGLLARGHGILALCGHIGDWESAGAMCAALGYPVHLVVRPLDHPYADRYLNRIRTRYGAHTIDKFSQLRHISRALRRNHMVCMVCDQYALHRGVPITFMGYPTQAVSGPAILAKRFPKPPY